MNGRKKRWLMLVFVIIFHCGLTPSYGKSLVDTAIAEIGNGEIEANNKGKYVKLYNKDLEASWCAGFVSYCLKKAGITSFGYELSARKIYNKGKELNILLKKPHAGCLIVFWRSKPTSWKGHIGIVEKVDNEYIHTIEGNVGKYPAKVKRFKYKKDSVPRLLGYIKVGE